MVQSTFAGDVVDRQRSKAARMEAGMDLLHARFGQSSLTELEDVPPVNS
jgi:hypothetical protein